MTPSSCLATSRSSLPLKCIFIKIHALCMTEPTPETSHTVSHQSQPSLHMTDWHGLVSASDSGRSGLFSVATNCSHTSWVVVKCWGVVADDRSQNKKVPHHTAPPNRWFKSGSTIKNATPTCLKVNYACLNNPLWLNNTNDSCRTKLKPTRVLKTHHVANRNR